MRGVGVNRVYTENKHYCGCSDLLVGCSIRGHRGGGGGGRGDGLGDRGGGGGGNVGGRCVALAFAVTAAGGVAVAARFRTGIARGFVAFAAPRRDLRVLAGGFAVP